MTNTARPIPLDTPAESRRKAHTKPTEPKTAIAAAGSAQMRDSTPMTDMIERWRDPVFDKTYQQVPAPLAARLTEMAEEIQGCHIYYERLNVLLAVASVARMTDPSTFQPDEPPSDNEKQLGFVIGQAFHEGCKLADVALATELP